MRSNFLLPSVLPHRGITILQLDRGACLLQMFVYDHSHFVLRAPLLLLCDGAKVALRHVPRRHGVYLARVDIEALASSYKTLLP